MRPPVVRGARARPRRAHRARRGRAAPALAARTADAPTAAELAGCRLPPLAPPRRFRRPGEPPRGALPPAFLAADGGSPGDGDCAADIHPRAAPRAHSPGSPLTAETPMPATDEARPCDPRGPLPPASSPKSGATVGRVFRGRAAAAILRAVAAVPRGSRSDERARRGGGRRGAVRTGPALTRRPTCSPRSNGGSASRERWSCSTPSRAGGKKEGGPGALA